MVNYHQMRTHVDFSMQNDSWALCWELCLAFCSTHLETQVPSLTSKKCCHVGIHVTVGNEDLGRVWNGKSQLPCSQRLRLHGLTSSDLRLKIWDDANGLEGRGIQSRPGPFNHPLESCNADIDEPNRSSRGGGLRLILLVRVLTIVTTRK